MRTLTSTNSWWVLLTHLGGNDMTNLTQEERDAVVEYLFSCETAFLVENLMNAMPESDLKALGVRLVEQTNTELVCSQSTGEKE